MISWEGKCCQGMKYYNRDRGAVIMGTTGSILLEPGGYEVYDLKGEKISEMKAAQKQVSSDLVGSDSMTDHHFANFIAAIRNGEKLHSPVSVGNIAVTMLQLSNISWEVNRELQIDPADGKIQHDAEAMKMWGRRIRERLGAASLGARCILICRHCGQEHPRKRSLMKQTYSRRNFIQSGALVTAACAASTAVPSFAQTAPASGKPSPIHLGLASYTFRNFTRAQLIGFMKQLNLTALNAKNVKDHLPFRSAGRAESPGGLCRGRHSTPRCRNHRLPQRRR